MYITEPLYVDVVKRILSQYEACTTKDKYGKTCNNERRACNASKECPTNDSWQRKAFSHRTILHKMSSRILRGLNEKVYILSILSCALDMVVSSHVIFF